MRVSFLSDSWNGCDQEHELPGVKVAEAEDSDEDDSDDDDAMEE